jgi:hypothetical protein
MTRDEQEVLFGLLESFLDDSVITEVLGAKGAPGVDTLSVIREYNLPGEFAPDALTEAGSNEVIDCHTHFFDPTRAISGKNEEAMFLLRPGDRVKFIPKRAS